MTKILQHIIFPALLCSTAVFAFEFEKGGVTFPMEKISAERFDISKGTETNLLKNSDLSAPLVRSAADGWNSGIWIFGQKNRDKFNAEAGKLATAKIVDTEDGKALELNRPPELETLMGKVSDEFTIAFNQTVKLPDENGGTYRLTFNSRNQVIGQNRYDQMVLLNFHDGSDPRPGRGKTTRNYIYSKISAGPQWHPYSYEFTAPPKTRDLAISIRADGCGRIQIRNLKLVKLNAVKTPITVELAPGKLLDNTFALSSGEPGVIAFKFKNNQPKGTLNVGRVTMNLELPAEISVNGTNLYFGKEIRNTDITVGGKQWKRWELGVNDAIISHIRNLQGFNGWNIACAMISGNAPAGTVWNNCRYYLTEDGKMVSTPETFSLKMMPALSKTPAPKQFYPGFSSVTNDIIFQQPEANRRFAEFAGKTGSTLVTAGVKPEYAKQLRENGIRLITSEGYNIANGFRIGIMDAKKKPADSNYLDKDGKPVMNHSALATCPMAVYNRTQYYKDTVLPQLKGALAGKDGLQPNWEPYTFVNKGCFCDNCREEFAKFAKLSPEKVKEIWSAQMQPGMPYRDQAIRFRAWQHGRLIKTLHEDCLKLGAAEVGFCPEVGTDQIIRYPNHFNEQWEFTPYEYAGDLKWLNVWGPYVWFIADQPYAYTKGANLLTWEMAQRVIRDYRKHFPNPAKRAKLMAMPHGSQLNVTGLGQPEGMAMDQISSFLAGYDASILYFFPRGYDHRFWKALADSNALIAANEDIVMNGKKKDDVTVVPQTPFPAPVENIEPRFLPDVRKSDLLQVAAFEKDGRILVAAGNFWEKGDVVFQLRVPGLKPDQEYTVQEKEFQRQFVPEQGKFFTGKMLADGILLHAGAMRWAFFEIAPATKIPAATVTSAEMRRELERCQKENRCAAEEEAARDKALHAENDIGELKSMSSGALSCKPVTKNGKPMLEVVSGKNTLLLNPCGMALESWTVDGTAQCSANFGQSAFWTPGKNGMVVNSNYRVTDQKISAEGLRVTAEFTTTVRSYPQLAGLKIIKTVSLSSDLKQVTFEVKLNNTQAVAMNDVGYRWSFIPAAWNNLNRGTVENNGRKFQRPNTYTLLSANCDPASEQIMRRLFNVKSPTLQIKGNLFRFAIPGKSVMQATFLPAEQFAGVAVWDTANMLAATFEPFYRPALIAPGGDISFSAQFKAE